jgi:hypothetical protein
MSNVLTKCPGSRNARPWSAGLLRSAAIVAICLAVFACSSSPAAAVCGDGTCDPAETCATCPDDCEECPPPPPDGVLPAHRRIDWSHAGVVQPDGTRGIPERTTICATIDAGVYGDGVTDAHDAIQEAIDTCPDDQVVFLPAGTYRLGDSLTVDHPVVIRGAGPTATQLVENGGNIILSIVPGSGGLGGEPWPRFEVDWTAGYAQGTTVITLADTSDLSVGQDILLDQLNDTRLSVTGYTPIVNETGNEGANGLVGNNGASRDGTSFQTDGTHECPRGLQQLVRVTAIDGNSVTIDPPLYMRHLESLAPQAFFWGGGKLEYAGIEDLKIDAQFTDGAITFTFSSNCWVNNV